MHVPCFVPIRIHINNCLVCSLNGEYKVSSLLKTIPDIPKAILILGPSCKIQGTPPNKYSRTANLFSHTEKSKLIKVPNPTTNKMKFFRACPCFSLLSQRRKCVTDVVTQRKSTVDTVKYVPNSHLLSCLQQPSVLCGQINIVRIFATHSYTVSFGVGVWPSGQRGALACRRSRSRFKFQRWQL